MRCTKALFHVMVAALSIVMIAGAAEAKMKMVPKVDNFILVQDYSGSMAMRYAAENMSGTSKSKIVMSKEVLQRLNDRVPDLGYMASLHTFAPFSELLGMAKYAKKPMADSIDKIKTDYPIWQRRTPMGNGLSSLRPVLDTLSGKTAVIVVSDGEENQGKSAVAEAQAIYSAYPNVCFHVISFADSKKGKAVLEKIAALNACSCPIQSGVELSASDTAMDEFLKCALYDMVNICSSETIMFRTVQFNFNKSDIRKDMKPILDEAVNIIKANDCNYILEGHTCSIGSDAYNLKLSQRRAGSVKDYLSKKGVNPMTLQTIGYGESRPKADNKTEEGRRLNRRVEIRVVD